MRPSRLEIEGFTSFRDPAVVDFEGADVFALTGPTGSGKSSLVDAMGFALYGRVHRYHDKLVHAAISQGRNEARVRLDFTAGGSSYTAVRVVRRTGPGRATTKEARLERDGDVVAGDEKGLTAAVTELLGLDFDQYCRCVVLPQGAFAEFLHDTPKGRQDLLTTLLDLGHYRVMGQAAGQRAVEAGRRAELLEQRLATDLAGATTEALEGCADRVATIDVVAAKVEAAVPGMEALAASARQAALDAERAADHHTALAAVRMPAGVAELAAELGAARAAVTAAESAVATAEAAASAAGEARAALGDRRPLDAAVDHHRRRRRLVEQRAGATRAQSQAVAAAVQADADVAPATKDRTDAEAALELVRHANRAHALLVDLHPGDPCPVCRQVVKQVPPAEEPADYAVAHEAVQRATKAEQAAVAAAHAAATARARADADVAHLDQQLAELDRLLDGLEDAEEVGRRVAAIDQAEQAVEAGRAAETAARRSARDAAARVTALLEQEQEARRAFDVARDGLAALAPPPAARVDLADDWRALAAWAADRAGQLAAEAAAQRSLADRLAGDGLRLAQEVAGWCRDIGVDPGGRPALEALAAARATAEADRKRIEQAMVEAAEVRDALDAARADEQVARTLAVHLRTDHFEKWVLDEALAELTDGATGLLHELSGGAYSLTLDPKSRDFAVIDHRNADEARAVRTLSGGETFLASLALALALSDRVAELAAAGAVRLEALFLDEGFGTLDADTLDVVASAIENLGAGGRMVGIVTHVRELAERVPLRFEITKGPATSTVDRVLL